MNAKMNVRTNFNFLGLREKKHEKIFEIKDF